MFYFPLARKFTKWLPFWGGRDFTLMLFFNIADMAISTGVGILIFFNKFHRN
jgi:signal peptidase II